MHAAQKAVEDFHRAMGQTIGHTPEIRDNELRARLIMEEAAEAANALTGKAIRYTIAREPEVLKGDFFEPNLTEAAGELCDLLYVTYGTAVAAAIDLEEFFNEKHRSNMTKEGGEVRGDGKQLKPPHFSPPDLKSVLRSQIFPEAEVVTYDQAVVESKPEKKKVAR